MSSSFISRQEDFLELCDHIAEAGLVAFDTEFVSESTYRPELGLLQFATRERAVAVDPLEIEDLSPWWKIMADDSTTVVVHGGQAEIRFCLHLLGQPPQKLYDIQLAEGFRCRSYPLSYSAIVQRVLDRSVDGSQTRTDWLRRPLSQDQLKYALEDVNHVLEIWQTQREWLHDRDRLDWAEDEMQLFVAGIVRDDNAPAWGRISGLHKLNAREFAIVQKLAKWREEEASYRNRPLRRILRDDLIVDLARRKPKNHQQATATRDMNRPEYKRRLDDILDVIQDAMEIPNDELPKRPKDRRQDSTSDEQVISRLLSLALSNRCAEMEVAQSLVGTNKDLAHLVRFHRHGDDSDGTPRVLNGWRNTVCGQLLKDVMDGKVSFRVAEPKASTPLEFTHDA